MPSGRWRITRSVEFLDAPIATAEFLVIDTETNGLNGDGCELTEVGAVLVGGGELHDRWDSLVRTASPLRRGVQRLTGITQAMVEDAPDLEVVLPALAERLEGRVMVAHNAPFDRRVLRQAFERIGLDWPQPPVLCTAALSRTLLPLQRRRGLRAVADALGIDVDVVHRALADAETCARVLCALFPRLCANALTIRDAVAMLAPAAGAGAKPPSIRRGSRPGLPQTALSSTSPSSRATRACTCSETARVRRCTSASRSRSAAEPARISRRRVRRPTGPRTPRSSTTAPRIPNSARWCSRTA